MKNLLGFMVVFVTLAVGYMAGCSVHRKPVPRVIAVELRIVNETEDRHE